MWRERTCLALGIAGGVAVLAVAPASGAGASPRVGFTTIDVPGAVVTRALGI